jgi:four helix bundle protein
MEQAHMGVQRLEDLAAFQLAVDFKLEVYRLIRESPGARGDWRFRAQLSDAASSVESCITEGWHRYRAGAMIPFLVYSRASLAEAERWLQDGVHRGYFTAGAIANALTTAGRCGAAITNLRKSLEPFAKKKRRS